MKKTLINTGLLIILVTASCSNYNDMEVNEIEAAKCVDDRSSGL